jgi:hypothetical protein
MFQADSLGHASALAAPLLQDWEAGHGEASQWPAECLLCTAALVATASPALALVAARCLVSIAFAMEPRATRRMPEGLRRDLRQLVPLQRVEELLVSAVGAVDKVAVLCLLTFLLRDGEAQEQQVAVFVSRLHTVSNQLMEWVSTGGVGSQAARIVLRGLLSSYHA